MSAHTPGPWLTVHEGKGCGTEWAVKCGHYYIASIHGSVRGTGGNPEANARLIAAAPKMLATIKAAYLLALQIPHGALRLKNQATLCELRDAIALATGENEEDIQDEYESLALAKAVA